MKDKLLIVTALGQLKAYKVEFPPKGSRRVTLLESVVLEEAHHRLGEKLSDLAGRHAGSTQKSWGAPMADSHNLRLELKRRLLKQVAEKVEVLLIRYGNEGCWLAAPKEINHQIFDALSPRLRVRIEQNLPHDLTKMEPKALIEHFTDANPFLL
jgi:hypothetical protein